MSQNYLMHFGNKNSGRYPRGSGENPHQHDGLAVKRAKESYKQTKKEFKAFREANPIPRSLYSSQSVKRNKALEGKYENYRVKLMNKKADIKEAKKEGGAEKYLRKQVRKYGQPGSVTDNSYGGMATKNMNAYKKRYGQKATDEMLNKNGSRFKKQAIAAGTLAVGAAALQIYLATKQ